MAAPPVALYVHVPFCVSRCPYCDFVVYAGAVARGRRSRVPAYLRALEAEIELRADAADAWFGAVGSGTRPPLGSLYLGGGTPSLLSVDAVRRIVDRVGARFGLAADAEVTLEANPGPLERGQAGGWRAAGITRLSVGAQSMRDAEIRALGRRHGAADVLAAVGEARAAGIGSINLDLLYDIPGQTLESWAGSLAAALALRPDHVSCYALTLDDDAGEGSTGAVADHLPATAGARRWRTRARARQSEDLAAAMYELAGDSLASGGLGGYEISNWARPGHESRHNLAYWKRWPYEAVGPGAHAFDGRERRWNAASLELYVAALAPDDGVAASLPPGGREPIDDRTARLERLILGLRLAEGVPRALADEEPLATVTPWALDIGLVEAVGDRLRLTTRGRLLSNELFGRLA